LITENNQITDKYLNVYKRLSKGGVGLIIPGNYFINKTGVAVDKNLIIDNDDVIEDLKKLTNLVHENNTHIIAQLNHGGRQCDPKTIGQTPISPSTVRDKLTGIKPKEITLKEIKETINDFAEAALRVKKAGFDGVQINAAHGYLVNQFLSPYTNKRKDKWGGSVKNRIRFLLEVYIAIRDKVGDNFPVLVKLNAKDNIKNGLSLSDSIIICKKLSDLGIDAIEVSGGIKETGFTTTRGDIPADLLLKKVSKFKRLFFMFIRNKLIKAAQFSEGYHLQEAELIKKNVNVPVILVGGLRKMAMMERIIENKQVDFISMSRPFIRQPNLVNQFIKKPNEEIISCVNCNKCTVEVAVNLKPLKCYYSS